jgi:fibronectin type 3 domain-containing protein
VEIRWTSTAGTKYRVRKQPEGAAAAVEIATAEMSPYIDRAVELGKTYAYDVQGVSGPVESAVSAPVRVTVRDEFAPKAPSGVTVVAGQNSVELAWERNTEGDLAGYRVYRAEGAGEFAVLADALEVVAYSDRQVEGGKTYRYRLTALDRSGNESQPSVMVQGTTTP